MKNYKYVAYNAVYEKYMEFVKLKDACEWAIECDVEEYSVEICNGGSFVARKQLVSKYIITDKALNYHVHTDKCDEDCEKEIWPYSNDLKTVGKLILKRI